MRKFGIKFARHHPWSADVKHDFIRCETGAEWTAVIERHYGDAAQARARSMGWSPAPVPEDGAAAAMADADTSCEAPEA
jgi:hypothetical protein